jgi:hypothetical protein
VPVWRRSQVKSWRRTVGGPRRAAVVCLSGLFFSGCAVHASGLVEAPAGGVRLLTQDNHRWRLRAGAESNALSRLEGHLVEIEGLRIFRTVLVSEWSVSQGLHGMQAWTGTLESYGLQLLIADRKSGAQYALNREAIADLEPFVGAPILLEGYVEGPQQIHVLYYRLLGEPAGGR